MTLVVTHGFHSAVADDPGAASAGEVLPSHWNANHTLTGQAALSQGGTGADLSATGGTGQYVKQATLGGAFTVGTIPASDVASAGDLTRVNDTNVTITLGGTPTGALLKAASITLGWTGTLGLARGGTAADLSATGGAGQYLKQATLGGAVTVGTIPASDIASGAALTSSNDTNVTITLGGTPASALLKAASITMGWTGTLAAARGGFGADVSAQSGVPLFATGVPTFTGTTGSGNFVRATSPTLVTPALGTPSSGTLTSCTGLPVGGIAAIAANTLVANATGSSATPTAVDISLLTAKATPAATDLVLLSDQAASGALKKATVSSLTSGTGVSSFNSLTGAVTTSVVVQVFTASGTYTPTSGMAHAIIECIGPGGGGGGTAAAAASVFSQGGGGGSGGYSRKYTTAAAVGASQTVTVGTGGGGGTAGNNAGSNGSSATSVGTICVANAGSGGAGSAGTSNSLSSGGAGGTAGTGDVTGVGAPGMNTITQAGPVPCSGGSSFLGGGGNTIYTLTNQAGAAATGFGSGGAGGRSANGGSNAAGGAGTNGLVIITEFINL